MVYYPAIAPFVVLVTGIFPSSHGLLIPQPTGEYTVALSTAKLIDESRVDPYDANHGKRNVMMSLFYPIAREQCKQICSVPYMPPVTAAAFDALAASFGLNGTKTFESAQLQVCCKSTTEAAEAATKFPLVLFSPGLGGSRLQYNALVQELASAGYAVATLDSTYDAAIVEYPDGTYVPGIDVSADSLPDLLHTRVLDAQFVLDQLGNSSVVQGVVPGASCAFDTDHAAFYGHSFGGATALASLMVDSRLRGGLNLDGTQYGNNTNIHAPAMLFGRSEPDSHNRTDDSTWQDVWDHMKGWKRELGLRNAEHNTFGDLPLLAELDGLPDTAAVQAFIGTLEGKRSFRIITTYVRAFFDFVVKGKESELFRGPSEQFPEVVVE